MKKLRTIFLAAYSFIRYGYIDGFAVYNLEEHVGSFFQRAFLTKDAAELYIKRRHQQWKRDCERDRQEIAEWIAAGEWPEGETETSREMLILSIRAHRLYH